MTNTTYNGWTNRATWLVNLWLDNDGYYETCGHKSNDAYQLGQMIRADVEEMQPEVTGLWADAQSTFLSEVNWKEIGANYIIDRNGDDVTQEYVA